MKIKVVVFCATFVTTMFVLCVDTGTSAGTNTVTSYRRTEPYEIEQTRSPTTYYWVRDFVKEVCEADYVDPPDDSRYITDLLRIASDEYGVSFEVALALAYCESGFRPWAVSRAGRDRGLGILQVSKIGLEDYTRVTGELVEQEELLNVETCVRVGLFLYRQIDEYATTRNDFERYVAYNVGSYGFKQHYAKYYSRGIDPLGRRYSALENYSSKKRIVTEALSRYDSIYEIAAGY